MRKLITTLGLLVVVAAASAQGYIQATVQIMPSPNTNAIASTNWSRKATVTRVIGTNSVTWTNFVGIIDMIPYRWWDTPTIIAQYPYWAESATNEWTSLRVRAWGSCNGTPFDKTVDINISPGFSLYAQMLGVDPNCGGAPGDRPTIWGDTALQAALDYRWIWNNSWNWPRNGGFPPPPPPFTAPFPTDTNNMFGPPYWYEKSIPGHPANVIVLDGCGEPYASWRIYTSTSLASWSTNNWTEVTNVTADINGVWQAGFVATNAVRYYMPQLRY